MPGVDGDPSDRPLAPGYRVELFAESDVTEQDVLDLWNRERALPPAEATRRLAEVLVVGRDRGGELVGVLTAYLERNARLAMVLWHLRVLVASGHRLGHLAVHLVIGAHVHLLDQYASGRDLRAAGEFLEIEAEGLRAAFPEAVSPIITFYYVGDAPTGAHRRVHYFPGVLAPPPPRRR